MLLSELDNKDTIYVKRNRLSLSTLCDLTIRFYWKLKIDSIYFSLLCIYGAEKDRTAPITILLLNIVLYSNTKNIKSTDLFKFYHCKSIYPLTKAHARIVKLCALRFMARNLFTRSTIKPQSSAEKVSHKCVNNNFIQIGQRIRDWARVRISLM